MRNAIFTIDVASQPRSLFSVQERATGDLTLILKNNLGLADEGSYERLPEAEILELRYSLHRSDESPTGVNVLKRTMITADGRRSYVRNHTRAVKKAKRFTLMHSQRTMDLSDPQYILRKNRGKLFSLGSYDPRIFQLFFQISVGPAEREFTYFKLSDDLNLMQIPFSSFRLVVMWCFLTLPSDVTASWQSYETKTDAELAAMTPEERAIFDWFPDGVDEHDAIDGFRTVRRVIREWHFMAMARDWSEELRERGLPVVTTIGGAFCREGRSSSVDFLEHARRCSLIFEKEDADLFDTLTRARSATEYWVEPGH
jgi:hypothetical protein